MAAEIKESNPKDLIGSNKLPLHLWPQVATAMGSLGLLDGMLKYGRANFRAIGVRASIYKDALDRHMGAWFEGEDVDPDSGLPHLAHALACLAILVDAIAADKLNDDRQYPGGHRKMMNELTPHVERLKTLRADATPEQHYTIQETAHYLWHNPKPVDKEKYDTAVRDIFELLEKQTKGLVTLPGTAVLKRSYDDDEAIEDLDSPDYWGV